MPPKMTTFYQKDLDDLREIISSNKGRERSTEEDLYLVWIFLGKGGVRWGRERG